MFVSLSVAAIIATDSRPQYIPWAGCVGGTYPVEIFFSLCSFEVVLLGQQGENLVEETAQLELALGGITISATPEDKTVMISTTRHSSYHHRYTFSTLC